jgi:hypothetical protein
MFTWIELYRWAVNVIVIDSQTICFLGRILLDLLCRSICFSSGATSVLYRVIYIHDIHYE